MKDITGKFVLVILACGLGVYVGGLAGLNVNVTMRRAAPAPLPLLSTDIEAKRLDRAKKTVLHPVRTAEYAPNRYEIVNLDRVTGGTGLDGDKTRTEWKTVLLLDKVTGDTWTYYSSPLPGDITALGGGSWRKVSVQREPRF